MNILQLAAVADTELISDVQRITESLGQLPGPMAKPVFLAVSGLPGTGKSYLCRKLAERVPLVVLESDALRKKLFSPPDYSSEESARLFRACLFLIRKLLQNGYSIILDATNLTERHRERLYSIAYQLDIKFMLVCVEAPPLLVKERLKSRQASPDNNSDADWNIYNKMRYSVQEIRRNHYTVDTSRDITPVLDKLTREVMN